MSWEESLEPQFAKTPDCPRIILNAAVGNIHEQNLPAVKYCVAAREQSSPVIANQECRHILAVTRSEQCRHMTIPNLERITIGDALFYRAGREAVMCRIRTHLLRDAQMDRILISIFQGIRCQIRA